RMKRFLAVFLILLVSDASAAYLTSDDLRRRCSGLEGEVGMSFCNGYLQGQIEAFAQREALGNSRRCVSGFSEAQLSALRSHLLEWLSPPGTSQMGFPAS